MQKRPKNGQTMPKNEKVQNESKITIDEITTENSNLKQKIHEFESKLKQQQQQMFAQQKETEIAEMMAMYEKLITNKETETKYWQDRFERLDYDYKFQAKRQGQDARVMAQKDARLEETLALDL